MKPFSAIENAIEEGDIENLNPKLVAASLLSGGKMGITLSEKIVDRYEIDRLPLSIFEHVTAETFLTHTRGRLMLIRLVEKAALEFLLNLGTRSPVVV